MTDERVIKEALLEMSAPVDQARKEQGIAAVERAAGGRGRRGVRTPLLTVAVIGGLMLTPPGQALASLVGDLVKPEASAEFKPPEIPPTSAEVPKALRPFCDAMPCSFITTKKWEGAKTGYELNKLTTPASECPDESAVLEELGYTNLGGFTGPCPTAKQMEHIEPNDPNELEDRIAESFGPQKRRP